MHIYEDGMLPLIHVDDFIILADFNVCIYLLIHTLKNGKEKYILTEEGSIDKFLSIHISKIDDKWYELAQSFLIKRIIEFIESECPTEFNVK